MRMRASDQRRLWEGRGRPGMEASEAELQVRRRQPRRGHVCAMSRRRAGRHVCRLGVLQPQRTTSYWRVRRRQRIRVLACTASSWRKTRNSIANEGTEQRLYIRPHELYFVTLSFVSVYTWIVSWIGTRLLVLRLRLFLSKLPMLSALSTSPPPSHLLLTECSFLYPPLRRPDTCHVLFDDDSPYDTPSTLTFYKASCLQGIPPLLHLQYCLIRPFFLSCFSHPALLSCLNNARFCSLYLLSLLLSSFPLTSNGQRLISRLAQSNIYTLLFS